MRWDIFICAAAVAAIPLLHGLLLRWRLQRRRLQLSLFQCGLLLLGLLFITLTLGNILWILIAIGSGLLQAIFSDTVFHEGLRLGFDRAVPLNEQEDLVAWGLLGPLCSGLCLNIVAHALLLRLISSELKPAADH